jgi:predicted enzyme related to lactoylglutathione lyase
MTIPRLWYATVFVHDFERAVDFYETQVGLPLRFKDERFGYASFATEGAGFSVARVDPKAPESPQLVGRHTGIGLGVPDLEKAHEALRSRGVRFVMAPTRQPWGGTLATFADPERNVLYLDQLRDE